jgi:hypothetical protein
MGLYSTELCVDEKRIYFDVMKELNFDLKRFINAHTDYAERMRTGRWFEKSFVLPGDTLPIYRGVKQDGIVDLHPGSNYRLSYYVRDTKDNESALIFDISSPDAGLPIPPIPEEHYDTMVYFNKRVVFERPGIKAVFPANTFYDNIPLIFNVTKARSTNIYSDIYELGNRLIAVNSPFRLSIKTKGLPADLVSKAFISSARRGYEGGVFKDSIITADALTLGKFYITTDIKPPVLTPVNIRQGKDMTRDKVIAFKMADDKAGINTFDGYVDGKWVLFQYDPRIRTIFYVFDAHVPPGKHELTMRITDRTQNITEQKYSFYR